MKTIEERAKEYSKGQWDEPTALKAYVAGATEQKAIDEQVRLKKCDDMTEAEYNHETAFVDWYRENGKGTPTYSDAIEWARKNLLEEVCAMLSDLGVFDWMASNDPEGFSPDAHKDQFRKCFIDE